MTAKDNKKTVNSKNPFKIYINVEEAVKEEQMEEKEEMKTEVVEKQEEVIEDNKEEKKTSEDLFAKKEKKEIKEIPKIKVLEVATGGQKTNDNMNIKADILIQQIQRKKKIRKMIKVWAIFTIVWLIFGLGIFGYYKKDMLASMLWVKAVKQVNLKSDYAPLSLSDFSPNTKFFYETYIRDYDYIYKNLKSKDKKRILWQLNSIVSRFIKNKTDYILFRLNYSKLMYITYKNILKSSKQMDTIKAQPPIEGGVKQQDVHTSAEKTEVSNTGAVINTGSMEMTISSGSTENIK